MEDEFRIWTRLLLAVQKEIITDTEGYARNVERIQYIQKENEWLARRIQENKSAEIALKERCQ